MVLLQIVVQMMAWHLVCMDEEDSEMVILNTSAAVNTSETEVLI